MSLPAPYYQDEAVTIYHGDARLILPMLQRFDAVVTDPPYNQTSLQWDVWPDGWPNLLVPLTNSLWCFGSARMFLDRRDEFADWKFAQDLVWEKHNGSGLHADRFRRVHELALQFYRGEWSALYKKPPIISVDEDRKRGSLRRGKKPAHFGGVSNGDYEYGGTRIMRSVIPVPSCHGYAVNETQKPDGIIAPLLEYSVPEGGIVLDCFAGSGTVAVEARRQGKRAVAIEARESQCDAIVRRMSQQVLALT